MQPSGQRQGGRRLQVAVNSSASGDHLAATNEGASDTPEQHREPLTFLFTDVEGSTRLWEREPDAMRLALARHDELIEDLAADNGGAIVRPRGEGDSRFGVFASASNAVAAACAIQIALGRERWQTSEPLFVRMALHSGEAELRDGDYYGSSVNRCARLRALAHGGQVLLSGTTAEGVRGNLPVGASLRDLGRHRLKDLRQAEHIFQLLHLQLPADFSPLPSLDTQAHNLPQQLTSFVGREREVSEIGRLLKRFRLVTLVGAGGSGKTRLAVQSAAEVLDGFLDGVWLVELTPLDDPVLVPPALTKVLGLREMSGHSELQTLIEHLRLRTTLLVLDNCEHLAQACVELADTLLRACPQLRILATSRSPLRVRGERTVIVPPLSLPTVDVGSSPELAVRAEAVMLFVERAQAVRPGFSLTPANAAVVAEICRRVDGLPLAIELAAARMRMLPPRPLMDQLGERLKLLVAGPRDLPLRQQTLRATIDWSHSLLAAGQQAFFRRLSVFAGGCSLEAAQAVCDPEHDLPFDVLDGLEVLVDQSMVVPSEDPARFRLMETVREYALERLVESGEAGALRQQHASYFLSLAETAEAQLRGPGQASWLERLELEHDNLRAALRWCVAQREVEQSLRLGAALWMFWHVHGHVTEGREHLAAVLELVGARMCYGPQTLAQAGALNGAGILAMRQGDYAAARSLLEESLAIRRHLGDRREIGNSLGNLGMVARELGDGVLARSLHEESLAIRRELGDQRGIAMSLNSLGAVARDRGEYVLARSLLEERLGNQT